MNLATLSVVVTIAGLAALICWLWPSRAVSNVIRAARDRRVQRALNDRSLADLLKLAQAGNGPAQYRLGYRYATGEGVPQDFARANHWFERAIQAGVRDASCCLALHYERGRGVPPDYVKAAELYQRAAEAGSADAQCNLGMIFLTGTAGKSNAIRAVRWLVAASAQGHELATKNLRWIPKNHAPLFGPEEQAELRAIEAAVDQGDTNSMIVLGWMHAEGFGKPQDPTVADTLYQRAQARGHLFAHVLRSCVLEAAPIAIRNERAACGCQRNTWAVVLAEVLRRRPRDPRSFEILQV